MSTAISATKKKMLYKLERDEDGYPPISVEGLWVSETKSGTVVLDNIPFYAKGIAPGDELAVTTCANGEIWFEAVIKSGGASVFRIHTDDDLDLPKIREELLDLGVPSEVDQDARLIAVEIPRSTDIKPVLSYLVLGNEAERFDFEESVLRHNLPD